MTGRRWFDGFLTTAAPQQVPVPPVDRRFTARLSSAVDGSFFEATFTVRTVSAGSDAEAHVAGLRRQLTQWSNDLTTHRTVNELEAVATELNEYLARIAWPVDRSLICLGASVQLDALPEARRIAAEWEELRSRLSVERIRNQLENEQLRHLRDDVFRKPDVARIYWLKNHPNDVGKVLDNEFELIAEKLGAAADQPSMAIARIIESFLGKLGPEHLNYLLAQLGQIFVAYDRGDLREELLAEQGRRDA